jgi:hypothetical protein
MRTTPSRRWPDTRSASGKAGWVMDCTDPSMLVSKICVLDSLLLKWAASQMFARGPFLARMMSL